jgi:hypothetical protein
LWILKLKNEKSYIWRVCILFFAKIEVRREGKSTKGGAEKALGL